MSGNILFLKFWLQATAVLYKLNSNWCFNISELCSNVFNLCSKLWCNIENIALWLQEGE